MTILFLILIVVACVALGFVILIQNPKGGGLAGNVGGINNQFMGVKQTTDVLEKGTWIFASTIAILAICSTLIFGGKSVGSSTDTSILNKVNTNTAAPATQPAAPANTTTAPAATGATPEKK